MINPDALSFEDILEIERAFALKAISLCRNEEELKLVKSTYLGKDSLISQMQRELWKKPQATPEAPEASEGE